MVLSTAAVPTLHLLLHNNLFIVSAECGQSKYDGIKPQSSRPLYHYRIGSGSRTGLWVPGGYYGPSFTMTAGTQPPCTQAKKYPVNERAFGRVQARRASGTSVQSRAHRPLSHGASVVPYSKNKVLQTTTTSTRNRINTKMAGCCRRSRTYGSFFTFNTELFLATSSRLHVSLFSTQVFHNLVHTKRRLR